MKKMCIFAPRNNQTNKIMARKKQTSNNFLYCNPNPTAKFKKNGEPFKWTKPDCVIRAFSIATEKNWGEAFDILCQISREIYDVPNSRDVLDIALQAQGFKKMTFGRMKSGEKRPTVKELAAKMIGKVCVFNIANHEVCAKDGCYFDVWDCGEWTVYNYWEKDL